MHEAADAAVTGLILAGGASRRFGTDKATYVLDGRTLAARVYDAVAAVTDEVLVSRRDGAQGEAGLPGRTVYDVFAGRGPLAGLHAGLVACRTPWLLAAACDLPFLTPAALGRVLQNRAPGVLAVVAQDDAGRRQPLCACYHVGILPLVTARLEAGVLRLRDLLDDLDAHGTLRLVRLPSNALRNVNVPDDLG